MDLDPFSAVVVDVSRPSIGRTVTIEQITTMSRDNSFISKDLLLNNDLISQGCLIETRITETTF